MPAETGAVEMIETDVLIVGGSLVGLSAATFLAWHGVPTLSVERHHGTAIHPRAGHFHLRTLEVLRSVGLEDRVKAESEKQFDPDGGINAVEFARRQGDRDIHRQSQRWRGGDQPIDAAVHDPAKPGAADP